MHFSFSLVSFVCCLLFVFVCVCDFSTPKSGKTTVRYKINTAGIFKRQGLDWCLLHWCVMKKKRYHRRWTWCHSQAWEYSGINLNSGFFVPHSADFQVFVDIFVHLYAFSGFFSKESFSCLHSVSLTMHISIFFRSSFYSLAHFLAIWEQHKCSNPV